MRQWDTEQREQDLARLAEQAAAENRTAEELWFKERLLRDAHKWAGKTHTYFDRNGGLAGHSDVRPDSDEPMVIGTWGHRR